MAEHKKIISLHKQSQQFATKLYNSIWTKFNILASKQDRHDTDAYPEGCRADIHKAVICEQLLLRDFLSNFFFRSRSLVIQENTDSVVAFCNIMCLATTGKWDYFKRFIRCSALIAEFFLYRYPRTSCPQFSKVPLIWCEVFDKIFSDEFCDNGGWYSLSRYANHYIPVLYIPLEKAVLQMDEPYEQVSAYCLQTVPKLSFPVTDATRLSFEMRLALDCIDVCRMPMMQEFGPDLPGMPAMREFIPGLPDLSTPRDPRNSAKGEKNEVLEYFEQMIRMVLSEEEEESAEPTFQLVTPIDDEPIPNVSDLKEPANPPIVDPVVDLENPADPMSPDEETSPSKDPVIEDSASHQPDANSRKRYPKILSQLLQSS